MSPGRLARLSELFKALAHPVRLRMFLNSLENLPVGTTCRTDQAEVKKCQRSLARELGMAPSTISHHFKDLRTSGLIQTRRQGKRVAFWIDRRAVSELRTFLRLIDE